MRLASTALLLVGALAADASAQCEIERLDPSSPFTNLPGHGALAGPLAVLGGYGNQVAVFERQPAGWVEAMNFTSPGLVLFENPVVECSPDAFAVGMTEDGPALNAEGSVYLFERSKGWQQPLKLKSNSPVGLDTFGAGLSLAGDTLAVGASMMVTDVLCGPGKGFVFERSGATWVQTAAFAPHDQNSSMGSYGIDGAVATDGETVVFGAGTDDQLVPYWNAVDPIGWGTGAVYVYERDAQGWHEEAKLFASVPKIGDEFGLSVDVEGTTLVAGAPGAGAGSVYVFERGPAGWSQTQVLAPSDGARDDGFGYAVELCGDRLVVGAPWVDVPGTAAVGAVYAFERRAGKWVETLKLTASDAALNAQFGRRVDLEGNQVLWLGRNQALARLDSLGLAQSAGFCAATPNSTGAAGRISAEGCDSVIGNGLVLRAEDLPPGEVGLFLLAADEAPQAPLGNGLLCLAAPILRLPAGVVDPSGVLAAAIDFGSAPASAFGAGSTARFQAWFRDSGFGAGAGTSDGVAVELQP